MKLINEDEFPWMGLCIKCNKGDKVLICNENGCPVVVHEDCLDFPATFDEMGKFYCPYCVYRREFKECCRGSRKAVLKEKDLSVHNQRIQSQMVQLDEVAEDQRAVAVGVLHHKEAKVSENKGSEALQNVVGDNGRLRLKDNNNRKKVMEKQNESEVVKSAEKFFVHNKMRNALSKSPEVAKSSQNLKLLIPRKRKRLLWTVEEEEMLMVQSANIFLPVLLPEANILLVEKEKKSHSLINMYLLAI